jgi:putative oxidoreductase
MSMIAALIGRILLAVIFIVSGIGKIIDPAPAAGMLSSVGLPANMALGVGIFELVAGLLLAIGLMTRLVSIVLFAYVGATILFFHNALADPTQQVNALKNLAIMGGMLMVFAYGQMRWSYDHWRARDKVHDAELRAARAEGKAEGATVVAGEHGTTVVKEPVVRETVVRDADPRD